MSILNKFKTPYAKVKELLTLVREKILPLFIWNGFGALFLQSSNILVSVALARILSLENFGAYSLLVATTTMFANFAQSGLGFLSTKLIAENIDKRPLKVAAILKLCNIITLSIGFIATILVWSSSQIITQSWLDRPELLFVLKLTSISIFFQVQIIFQTGAIQGFSAFSYIGKFGAVSGILNLTLICFGGFSAGLKGAILGYTVATAIRSITGYLILLNLRKIYKIQSNVPITKNLFFKVINLAMPSGLAGLVTIPSQWIVNILISHLPNGLVLVGVYTIANQIRLMGVQLPILLNSVVFSLLSKAKGNGDNLLFRKIFHANLAAGFFFALCVSFSIYFLSPLLLSIWSVKNYDAVKITQIIALSIIPEVISFSLYQLIQSAGIMWRSLFQIAIPRDFFYVVSSFFCIQTYGVIGVSSAYLTSQILGLILTYATINHRRTK